MEMSVKQMVLGYLALYINPFVVMYAVGILLNWQYYHIIEDRETMNSILKKLKLEVRSATVFSVQNRTMIGGYFAGWRCMGVVEITYEEPKLSIFCGKAFYEQLKEISQPIALDNVKGANAPIKVQDKPPALVKIDVFVRKGTYKNFYYNKMKLDLSHIAPIGDQQEIVSKIACIYDKLGRATVFIDGVSNAGKSTIGFLLAKEMRGGYCHTFNPTEPGDHLTTLTMEHMFEDGPLVLVIEEVDELLKKIYAGAVTINRDIPTLVHNKSTWSSFLDDMLFYKKVVLIMTSNTAKTDLDVLDPAYLRSGRVHAAFTMPAALPCSDV